MRLPSPRSSSRAGVACAVAVLLVDLWSFANGQPLDPSAGAALGAAAANHAGGGLRDASVILKETGLGASIAEAGGAAAKAAVGALAAGSGASIQALPNPNRGGVLGGGGGGSQRQETERHKEVDRASEAIGSGRQQVLSTGGGGLGDRGSIFATMGTAPGAELTSPQSAPKGYVPKPYSSTKDGEGGDKGKSGDAEAKEPEQQQRSIGPFPLPNQPGTGGAGWDPQVGGNDGAGSMAPGAKSFPGSGDAPRASLYATNDAGTGPAPVSGGGFQPLQSGGGFADGGKLMGGAGGGGSGSSASPLLGGSSGSGSSGSGSGSGSSGSSSVAPAPLVGGAVVGQDGMAALPVPPSLAQRQQQQPQSSSAPSGGGGSSATNDNGGVGADGLIHAPGAAASAPLGVVDTQPATTTVTGTAPGGLPIKMTIGR